LFGAEQVPGVGFGMGDVTIRDYLETYNLMPKDLEFSADLYICNLGTEFIKPAQQLADVLRNSGLKVAVDLTGRKLAAQVKTADKQGAGYVVCIGENEVRNQVYQLKSLKDGTVKSMGAEEIITFFKTSK
jgi:histidyl-tRNA synthetase